MSVFYIFILCMIVIKLERLILLSPSHTKDRYMAPEVFKHRRYDKKVDVFSFAMILYEVNFIFYKIRTIRLLKKVSLFVTLQIWYTDA